MPEPKAISGTSDFNDPMLPVTARKRPIPNVRLARRIRYLTGFIALVLSLMPIAIIVYFHYAGNPSVSVYGRADSVLSMSLKR